ncbi:MAG: carbohydrate ABC transporter permease [Clostridiales bacterium]|nr:carbohydrate ABC transporter permease [Clostridiales bacterium]
MKAFKAVLRQSSATLLFLLFMFPFIIILLNVGKTSYEITANPIAFSGSFSHFFENLKTIWTSPNIRYMESFMYSVLITVLSVAFILLTSSMAAWVLARTKTKISSYIFMMFVAAMVIPFQIVMLPLVAWFRDVAQVTGIPLLNTPQGLIFAYIGFGAPLSIFMYHGFVKSIPMELEEAAHIDGCSRPRTFFLIILPLLKPITVTVLILNGIWIWNDYLLPLMILNIGKQVQTLPLAVQNFAGSFVKKWDLILLAALMAMLPIVIVYLFCQKYIIKGMTEGAIK